MTATWIGLLLALAVGGGLATQVALNNVLRGSTSAPAVTAVIQTSVVLASVTAYALATRGVWPSRVQLAAVPWYGYLGGVLGALYVVGTIRLAPRLGPALLFALIVAGQLGASIVFDHFGLFGFARHPVSAMRVLGVALVIAGAVVVQRF